MGKLLTGRYGDRPEAESMEIPLRDCHQRLGMKPTDFVSQGEPKFFTRSFDAGGRYLVFLLPPEEAAGSGVWKAGYYLLPLSALDALKAFGKKPAGSAASGRRLPVQIECKREIPPEIRQRAERWGEDSQPLFFKCGCDHLEMRLDPPWALRSRWRAKLRCPDRCQPQQDQLL